MQQYFPILFKFFKLRSICRFYRSILPCYLESIIEEAGFLAAKNKNP